MYRNNYTRMQHIESDKVSPLMRHRERWSDSVRGPFLIRVLDNTPIAECGEALHWPQYKVRLEDTGRLNTYRICKHCMRVVLERETNNVCIHGKHF